MHARDGSISEVITARYGAFAGAIQIAGHGIGRSIACGAMLGLAKGGSPRETEHLCSSGVIV